MPLILKSLGVASTSGNVAELFCRNIFGGAAVDMGFERGLVVDHVTGWTNDNVGQHARRQEDNHLWQQKSKRPKGSPGEATRAASVAIDVDMVKEQMGSEKPVSLIGSPMW